MDPLALLSNLHGDGPATLQRLRRNGCDSLTTLLASDLQDLVPILGWLPERAQRFLREGDALARRLGTGLLEPEEEAAGPARAPAPAAVPPSPPAAQPAPAAPLAEGEDPDEDVAEPAPPRRDAREQVLERWAALDAAALDAAALEDGARGSVLVPRGPAPAPAATPARGRSLVEARLDGLDPARLVALQQAGVTTLDDLAQADDLDLHRRSGLPFTLVGRLCFLARREVGRFGVAPRPRAPGSAGSIEAAGPFA